MILELYSKYIYTQDVYKKVRRCSPIFALDCEMVCFIYFSFVEANCILFANVFYDLYKNLHIPLNLKIMIMLIIFNFNITM